MTRDLTKIENCAGFSKIDLDLERLLNTNIYNNENGRGAYSVLA